MQCPVSYLSAEQPHFHVQVQHPHFPASESLRAVPETRKRLLPRSHDLAGKFGYVEVWLCRSWVIRLKYRALPEIGNRLLPRPRDLAGKFVYLEGWLSLSLVYSKFRAVSETRKQLLPTSSAGKFEYFEIWLGQCLDISKCVISKFAFVEVCFCRSLLMSKY